MYLLTTVALFLWGPIEWEVSTNISFYIYLGLMQACIFVFLLWGLYSLRVQSSTRKAVSLPAWLFYTIAALAVVTAYIQIRVYTDTTLVLEAGLDFGEAQKEIYEARLNKTYASSLSLIHI